MRLWVAGSIIVALVGCKQLQERADQEAVREAKQIEAQVGQEMIADTIEQYEIVKRSGSAIEAYVHASSVSDLYLLARERQRERQRLPALIFHPRESCRFHRRT